VLVSNYTTNPPEIDGVVLPGEWTNEIPITLNGYIHLELTKEGVLYLMNDENNIYLAVLIPDADQDADYLFLGYDQGNEHIATDGGEDAMGFNLCCLYKHFSLGYVYLHWDYAAEWWSEDLKAHGNGKQSYVLPHPGVLGKYRYEFVKPLKSGDNQDMRVNLSDTIGFDSTNASIFAFLITSSSFLMGEGSLFSLILPLRHISGCV
jgi:hypothetical protein